LLAQANASQDDNLIIVPQTGHKGRYCWLNAVLVEVVHFDDFPFSGACCLLFCDVELLDGAKYGVAGLTQAPNHVNAVPLRAATMALPCDLQIWHDKPLVLSNIVAFHVRVFASGDWIVATCQVQTMVNW